MVRKAISMIALALVAVACGSDEIAGPVTTTPRIPIVIGQPPTPDPGDPGTGAGEQWLLGPAYLHDYEVELLGGGRGLVTISGDLPSPCHVARLEFLSPGPGFLLDLEVWSQVPADVFCAQVLAPFQARGDVTGLREGVYSVRNGGKEFMTIYVPAEMAGTGDGFIEVPVADPFDALFPVTDAPAYNTLGQRVEQGHQPWVLDPVLTAGAYLEQFYGQAPADLAFRQLEGRFGEVRWSGGRVVVWQPAVNGPWVVTGSEIAAGDVSISDYTGGRVYVGVTAHKAGHVVVAAGAFASEWSDTHEQAVAEGDLVEAELRLGGPGGPGPDKILVEVRYREASGSDWIAQFAVHRTDITYDD